MFCLESTETSESNQEEEEFEVADWELYMERINDVPCPEKVAQYSRDWERLSSRMVDLFENALNSPEELNRVLLLLNEMAEYPYFPLRQLLMEKLPKLAVLCHKAKRLDIVDTVLWPFIARHMSDKNEMLNTATEVSLLFLVKEGFLGQELLERDVYCCAKTALLDSDPAAVVLMGKLAPLIGKEATEKYYLDKFIQMCSHKAILMQLSCVQIFGHMCATLGTKMTEKHLVPVFLQLCQDKKATIRMFCARMFISVSCYCSLNTRKTVLSTVFANLLMDNKPCVRVAAYYVLGAFICTFTEPCLIKIDYDENGELLFMGEEGWQFRMRSIRAHLLEDAQSCEIADQFFQTSFVENDPGNFNFQGINSNPKFLKNNNNNNNNTTTTTTTSESGDSSDEEADDVYNTFRFWRMPLPTLDSLDLEPEQEKIRDNLNILDNKILTLCKISESLTTSLDEIKSDFLDSNISSPDSGWNSAETTPHVESVNSPDPKAPENSEVSLPDQETVPQLLLDYFLSMAVSSNLEDLDQDIAQECAYCLPAVVLTLGPTYWPYIKYAYKCLSMNLKWRVRKTLVSSIHKLASILGEEIASRDLTPIFEEFLLDLDEVKIGALERLSDFLKLVSPETRYAFLPHLKEILKTDFEWNWRYRNEFGEQLRLLIHLFTPADWLEHFGPLAVSLLCDKVAAVRQKAVSLFSDLVLNLSSEPKLQEKLLSVLLKEFAEHSSWRRRQVFVLLCSELARNKALNSEDFCSVLLGHLVLCSEDPVPNVSLCVARCLFSDVISSGYLSPCSSHYQTVVETIKKLRESEDPDVRYFASLEEELKENEQKSNITTEEEVKVQS